MTAADKTKLNGIATGAEVNQNAFSNVKVGETTVSADAKTDTLELVAGSNITLTPDATNDKVTITATDTVYTHPSYTAHTTSAIYKFTNDAQGHVNSATAAVGDDIKTVLGTTAVNRATGDANGNNIASTYAPKASPALTGTPTAPTAAAGTNTTQIATTAFVTSAIGTATAGALQYKGAVTAEIGISGTSYKKGWYWIVNMPDSTTTSITIAGKACEAGDMIIAKQDKTSTLANDLDIIQSNIEVLSNGEIDAL